MTIDLHFTKSQLCNLLILHFVIYAIVAWVTTRRSLTIEWGWVFSLSFVGQIVYFFGLSTGQWYYIVMATICCLLLTWLLFKYATEIDQSHKVILSLSNPLVAFVTNYFVYWAVN